jgi:hypothetical protein
MGLVYMRRALMVAVMSLALVAGLVGPAHAAKVTVASNGSPDLSKMVVNNGSKAVVVKLYGAGGKDVVRWSYAQLKGTNGVVYEAKVAWYSDKWMKSLYRGQTSVNCPGFKYTWNATGKFWRVFVPRSCLGKLTNKIKVYAEHVARSAMPGAAGWSRWVARG